jgi:glycosyltransferase involved in cell wall biosynthesis
MRVLIVLPTYDEADNIGWLIGSLLDINADFNILVVDDSSPDHTAERAQQADREGQVKVVERTGKMGLGSAQRRGMAEGVNKEYDRVVVMDADGSHAPQSVPRLISATEEADVAIGSRYVAGGKIENWAWHRRLLSRGANTMARLVLGRNIHDWTSSFRCYRTSMLKEIPLDSFRSDGYAFAEEMLFECVFRGFKTVEVPIVFVERRAGRSKIDRKEFVAAVWRLFAMGVKRLKSCFKGTSV